MFRRILHQVTTVILACLLAIGLWSIFPGSAQASKAMKALAFDATSGTVEVAVVYETSFSAQKMVMKSLKASTKLMKKAPGFKGLAMLQSQDGKQVIVLSQWQDLVSYQAYTPPPTTDASQGIAPASAPLPAPTQTLIFNVAGIQTSIAGSTPALRGKEAVVQLAQFTPKDPDTRSQVLSQVGAMVPEILQKQPIPQSIVLLEDATTGAIALLTNWNCSALFEDVGKPGAIDPGTDLTALADNTQSLYNVVNLVPAEVKKKEEKFDD